MNSLPERSCRRSGARWSAPAENAWLEGQGLDGRPFRLPLRDVSPAGISFFANESAPPLEPGVVLAPIRLRLADCEVEGELVVMHVTATAEVGTVCGAMVYPADEGRFATLLRRAEEQAGG